LKGREALTQQGGVQGIVWAVPGQIVRTCQEVVSQLAGLPACRPVTVHRERFGGQGQKELPTRGLLERPEFCTLPFNHLPGHQLPNLHVHTQLIHGKCAHQLDAKKETAKIANHSLGACAYRRIRTRPVSLFFL
jgi:hypothetical protein